MRLSKNKKLALHYQSLICASILIKSKIRKTKKWAVHPLWKSRKSHGAYESLLKSLANEDCVFFKKFSRMMPSDFDKLKEMLKCSIKKNPRGNKALSVGHRLAVTLRYLASGDSMASISFAFRIGFATACKVIRETCSAIYQTLKDIYLRIPDVKEWEKISEKYWKLWQFPNCLGSVDGKHIRINSPPHSGSSYFNYKKYFSTVLMAVVDAEYKFVFCEVGSYGSNSDGGIWKASKFGSCFDDEKIKLPNPKFLPNSKILSPYVLIGDEAFQLRNNFMRPFPGKKLDDMRRVYNYRLSRARRCVENAFGVLVARWRILRNSLSLKINNVENVVLACITLHIYLMNQKEINNYSLYCPNGYTDEFDENGSLVSGKWREESCDNSIFENLRLGRFNYSNDSFKIRENFVKYFNTTGSILWQAEKAGINEFYK